MSAKEGFVGPGADAFGAGADLLGNAGNISGVGTTTFVVVGRAFLGT
jgi:hypothetical protein